MIEAFPHNGISGAASEPELFVLQLVCAVDTPALLRTALDNGADCIRLTYEGMTDECLAVNSALTGASIAKGIRYAHDQKRQVVLELTSLSSASTWKSMREIIDRAANMGFHALLLRDPALMLYAAGRHPEMHLHYLFDGSALDYRTARSLGAQFGISRVVLPYGLPLFKVSQLTYPSMEIEIAGTSPLFRRIEKNLSVVHLVKTASNSYATMACEEEDTLMKRCSTAEDACNDYCYHGEDASAATALDLLPELAALGVDAISISARTHSPAFVAQAVRTWRMAVDDCHASVH